MKHRLILILIAILSCLPAYSKKEVSVFQNIYAERNVVKNGIRGINIVVSLDASQVMGRKIRIRGLLETGTKPTQYFSSDEVVQVVDMPYFQHLEFFIPSDNLPDGYYTARVNITDITDGTPEYLGHHHVTSFTIDRAKKRLQPVIDWSGVPRTISGPEASISVGCNTPGKELTMKIFGHEVGRAVSPDRISYSSDKWKCGHTPVDINGEIRIIFREYPLMASNAVISRNNHDGKDYIDIDFDLSVFDRNYHNSIGINACFATGGKWVTFGNGKTSVFTQFTGKEIKDPVQRITVSVPWDLLPDDVTGNRMSLHIFPYTSSYGWKSSGDFYSSAWRFTPNQLTRRSSPCPQPVNSRAKPTLTWLSQPEKATSANFTVKVGVNSKSAITDYSVKINGIKSRGIKSVKNDGYDMVISEPVTLRQGENTIQVEVTNSAGSTTETRTFNFGTAPAPAVTKNLPLLTWISAPTSTQENNVTIKVGVKSQSAISNYKVWVNGAQARGIKAVKNDGYDLLIEQPITLQQGDNTVRVDVTNADGITSESRTVNYIVKSVPVVIEQSLKKIALVVGNANYSGQELKNTVNDATAISSTLKALGFDVISVTDVNRRQLDGAINDFGSKARNYDVAMFYYAGHGIQYKGDNYLVPVNANLQSESDVEYECTNVNRILSKLEESGCKMKIIVLDACRNNPFERAWHRGAGNGRGLSVINAPIGTLISYATSPGTTASDGDGDHSPYTQAFLEVLAKKDLPIERVFKKVAAQVVNSTNRTQTPWYASSLFEGEFIFNPSK